MTPPAVRLPVHIQLALHRGTIACMQGSSTFGVPPKCPQRNVQMLRSDHINGVQSSDSSLEHWVNVPKNTVPEINDTQLI